ncbi:fatty acid desaturase [Arachidicoccus ginsenosidimutans]|uniref:fatty acid desaturase family protein n=1 Tax=Arachidicoccus sp. BS20 TaxID=1850526 RepID=UPI0007F0D978|nr:acyl-CoA desaturase [Arachidicoccus sp. BS20]ANI89164.1 fatty acid desaturase [Arachidicoccus sp. BS20]
MLTPKFAKATNSFHVELKHRINNYFESTGKPTTGGFRLFSKAVFLEAALVVLYISAVFFTPEKTWVDILLCVLMGIVIAGIGFNIMHDGGHGSFSKHPLMNRIAAYSTELVGASQFMWNMKHNVIHHAYTNIDGVDDDIDAKPFLRMATTQKKYKMHRFQHLYFWILYAVLYLYWVLMNDYTKYFKRKVGDIPLKKMRTKDHILFWAFKVVYCAIFIVIPMARLGFVDWLVGYLAVCCTTGLILSVVFQLAHTVEHTQFPMPDKATGKMEDEWAVHQLKTTANFATKNKLISWYVGGLNFQVEHHLFPKISHIHYPAINKIVKQACKEYNVTYIEYKYMASAFVSHVHFLREMGKSA